MIRAIVLVAAVYTALIAQEFAQELFHMIHLISWLVVEEDARRTSPSKQP